MTTRIVLPYPPSTWDLYEGWGATRHLSDEYKKWRHDAGHFFRIPKEPLAVPFSIDIALKRQSKRHDLDNRSKAILDVLQHYGVIKNDSLCARLTMTWDEGMKDECVVLLQPSEEAIAA